MTKKIFLRVLLRGAGTSILPARSAFSQWHFISVAEQSNPWPRHRIGYMRNGRFVDYVVLVQQRYISKFLPPFLYIFRNCVVSYHLSHKCQHTLFMIFQRIFVDLCLHIAFEPGFFAFSVSFKACHFHVYGGHRNIIVSYSGYVGTL